MDQTFNLICCSIIILLMLCIAFSISPQQNLLSLLPWLLFEFYGFISMIGSFILIYFQDDTLKLFDGDILIMINIMNVSALIFGLFLMYRFHRNQYLRFCHLLNRFLFCNFDTKYCHCCYSTYYPYQLQSNLIVTHSHNDNDYLSQYTSDDDRQMKSSENEIQQRSGIDADIDLDMTLREFMRGRQKKQIIKRFAKIVTFHIVDDNTHSGHDTQTVDESMTSSMEYTDNSSSYFSHIPNSSDDANLN